MSITDPQTQPNTGLPAPASALNQASTSSVATGAAGQSVPLGAASTPYEYQNYVASLNVVLGSQLAGMLGLSSSANKPISISAVLEQFQSLSVADQTAIERMLVSGGFYADSGLEGPVPLGQSSQYNQSALADLLLSAYNANPGAAPTKSSASSTLVSAISSGAGQTSVAPSPILGGGNAYQVELTNPQDLYDQLYTTFESTLGRAPTQKELNNFVNTFQQQQSKYQTALNQQQEQVSLSHFNAQVQQRNTEEQYQQTPNAATGPEPNGPFHSAGAWVSAFLQANNLPVTQSNTEILLSIIQKNGGWAKAQQTKNPLGVESGITGQKAKTTGPNGIKTQTTSTFTTWGLGMKATLDGLSQSGYSALMTVLESGKPIPDTMKSEVSQEIAQWTNGKIKTLPKANAKTVAVAHATAAAVAKSTSAYNKKQSTPPPGKYNPTPGEDYTGKSFNVVPNGKPTGKITQPQAKAIRSQEVGGPAEVQTPTTTPATTPTTQPATTPTATPTTPNPQTGWTGNAMTAVPPKGSPQRKDLVRNLAANSSKKATDLTKKGGKKGGGNLKPWQPPPPVGQAPYSGNTLSPTALGSQEPYSTGDMYVGPNTLIATQAPSATGAAFTEATTGANALPFAGNNYLNAFNTIADMVASGRAAG